MLHLQGVKKRFGKKEVLRDINLEIKQGEIFGLIGTSGAGKTTLLRTLIGYYLPDEGSIVFEHLGNNTTATSLRKNTGFATQDSSLYGELSVRDNLLYFGKLYGVQQLSKRIEDVSALTNIHDFLGVKVEKLSGGMKKRVDIACSLLHKPNLLILDEPTAGLDPLLKKSLWHLIERIRQSGTTILLSSHMINDIEHLCDRVGMLVGGKFLFTAPPEVVVKHYSKRQEIVIQSFPGNYAKIAQSLKKFPIFRTINKEHSLLLYIDKAFDYVDEIIDTVEAQGEQVISLDVRKPSLSEAFEFFTHEVHNKKEH